MRERERRRVQRQLKRAQQDANWRAFLPGADKPETVNPPELVASPSDPWPLIRGPPLDRFMRRKEVLITTSLSHSELYALMAEDRFPKGFKLTGTARAGERAGVVVWSWLEVSAWMDSRKASRDST